MKKIVLAVLLTLPVLKEAVAQVVLQEFEYVNNMTTGVPDMAMDNQGNFIYLGFEYNPTDWPIVTKYSPTGNLLWGANCVGFGHCLYSEFVTTDASGNIFVLGTFGISSAQLVGGSIHQSNGNNDLLIAKYSPSGTLLWSQSFGGADTEKVNGLECDAAGNVLILGRTQSDVISFGNNVTLTQSSTAFNFESDFVLKLSTTGTPLWVTGIEGSTGTYTTSMDVSASGEVYLAGGLNGQIRIGANTHLPAAPSVRRVFIVKLDGAGNQAMVKASAPGTESANGTAIHVAPDGDFYVAGNYSNSALTLDGVALPMAAQYFINGFTAKFNPAGIIQWAKPVIHQNGNNTGANGSFFTIKSIAEDATGGCLITAAFAGEYTLDGITVTSSMYSDSHALLGRLDAQGNAVWAHHLGSGGTAATPNEVLLDADNNCYFLGDYGLVTGGYLNSTFGNLPFYLTDGSFMFKVTAANNYNQISGRIFYDFNSNGIKDGADTNAPGFFAQAQSSGLALIHTTPNGQYKAFVDTGNYTISLPSAPLYYTAAPASHTGNFTTIGNIDTTRHFALQPIAGMQDLELNLLTPLVHRPGYENKIYVRYRNKGTTTLNASVQLTLDGLEQFQSSTPPPSSVSGNTLTWDLPNLSPTQGATIPVTISIPTSAVFGTPVTHTASVLPLAGDLIPADNTDSEQLIVSSSFDPNDKQVSRSWLHPDAVAAGEWLDYTIRFQNTGNDTAFFVMIADTLSTMLNVSSLEMLASSHPFTWSIKNNQMLEFRFDNILLPDSNVNEPASHGFVTYRIKPNTNLVLGDLIANNAHIYFDFNEAVITNTAYTIVSLVASVNDIETNPLHIYPNPNKGTFTVQCTDIWQPQVTVELRNILGQTVWQQNLATGNGKLQQVISTNGLAKGVYYLQVETEKGSKVQKVVIE